MFHAYGKYIARLPSLIKQPFGNEVFKFILDNASKRSHAIFFVKAFVDKPTLCGALDHEPKPFVMQANPDIIDKQVKYLTDFFSSESIKDDNIVKPCNEFWFHKVSERLTGKRLSLCMSLL
jgi:hypothetical protein